MTQPKITDAELLNFFTHHPPQGPEDIERYQAIRNAGLVLSTIIRDSCPSSPDTTVAIRHVRDAVMNANCAIACYGPE